jgi:hypothetical protein
MVLQSYTKESTYTIKEHMTINSNFLLCTFNIQCNKSYKNYQTVETVPKYNRKITETDTIVHLAHIYITVRFPGVVHEQK